MPREADEPAGLPVATQPRRPFTQESHAAFSARGVSLRQRAAATGLQFEQEVTRRLPSAFAPPGAMLLSVISRAFSYRLHRKVVLILLF
jgi:hypothetical protein